VFVLQLLQQPEVLEVIGGGNEGAELLKLLSLSRCQAAVPGQELYQVALPQRDVVLAIGVFGHEHGSCALSRKRPLTTPAIPACPRRRQPRPVPARPGHRESGSFAPGGRWA